MRQKCSLENDTDVDQKSRLFSYLKGILFSVDRMLSDRYHNKFLTVV